MMQLRIFYLILIAIIFSCGSPTVSIDENNYQPKIVIEGYIYPDCPVSDIKISRNFPLNTTVNYDSAFISDALVTIEEVGGAAYNLTFEKGFRSYLDVDTNFTIESGKQYKLNVTATIDGKEFHASSITDVPQGTNFYIDEQQSVLDTMRFMEVDESGNLKNFSVTFSRAELVSIYMLSIKQLNKEVEEGQLRSEKEVLLTNPQPGFSSINIPWYNSEGEEFYGDFQAILYAADKNFEDFFLTHDNNKSIDGNMYAPILHIDGDGIGVFGSAITDTVYFTVLRN